MPKYVLHAIKFVVNHFIERVNIDTLTETMDEVCHPVYSVEYRYLMMMTDHGNRLDKSHYYSSQKEHQNKRQCFQQPDRKRQYTFIGHLER